MRCHLFLSTWRTGLATLSSIVFLMESVLKALMSSPNTRLLCFCTDCHGSFRRFEMASLSMAPLPEGEYFAQRCALAPPVSRNDSVGALAVFHERAGVWERVSGSAEPQHLLNMIVRQSRSAARTPHLGSVGADPSHALGMGVPPRTSRADQKRADFHVVLLTPDLEGKAYALGANLLD